MIKYEYYEHVVGKEDLKIGRISLRHALNAYGKEGWKVILTIEDENTYTFIMMREFVKSG